MVRKVMPIIFLVLMFLMFTVYTEASAVQKERPIGEQTGIGMYPPNIITGKHFALQAAKIDICPLLMSFRYGANKDVFPENGLGTIRTEHNENTQLLFGVFLYGKKFLLDDKNPNWIVNGAVHISYDRGKQEQFGPPKWTNNALTAASYPKVSLFSSDPEIATLEQKINIYDTHNTISVNEARKIANQILKKDKRNAAAFRCLVACWIKEGRIDKAKEMCNKILEKEPTSLLAIEAYNQLGDIYLDESEGENRRSDARTCMEKGIALIRKYYSSIEIESLVNGTNVRVINWKLTGTSNTVRELYVKKFEIEGVAPYFKEETYFDTPYMVSGNKINELCFRTNMDFFY